MSDERTGRVAILYPGDEEARRTATPANNRFAPLFSAFAAGGIHAEPAVYHDAFCNAVREQLLRVDAVLVWVNPIESGRDRTMLDAMLLESERGCRRHSGSSQFRPSTSRSCGTATSSWGRRTAAARTRMCSARSTSAALRRTPTPQHR